MKTKDRLIVQLISRQLLKSMESDNMVSIDPVWRTIYSHAELIDIVKWLFMDKHEDETSLQQMSSEELLCEIGDDIHMVSYFIEQKQRELEQQLHPTTQSITELFTSLGIETHYLNCKPLASWDEYDRTNFNALQRKAGLGKPVFGIFLSTMNPADRYITPVIGNYYNDLGKAESALGLLDSTGEYSSKDYQILPL